MASVTVKERIDHPVDAVWAVVSDFGGIAKYMRGMPPADVEGEGLGSERSLAMGDKTVVERCTWLDDDAHHLGYTVLEPGPLPVTRYVAAVRLSADGDGTLVDWSSSFEPAGVSEEEAVKMVEGIYRGGIKGYAKFLGA